MDEFVDAIGATVLAIDRELARRAAGLRARHRSLRLGDALSVATAPTAGAELLTLERPLHRVARRELEAE